MKKYRYLFFFFIAFQSQYCFATKDKHYTDQYNVIWNSQSKQASESMPCGGGDVGLNVWVENNEFFFYIGKDGTFDENNTQLKLGRVRLQFSPNPFAGNGKFKQELKLKGGYVEVSGLSQENIQVHIKIWVEVNRPVIHVEINSKQEISVNAIYENWRNAPLLTTDRRRCYGLGSSPTDKRNYNGDIYTWPDSVHFENNTVAFYHRNQNDRLTFDKELDLEGLSAYKHTFFNPLKDLTFGGIMQGDNFKADNNTEGKYYKTDYKGWKLTSIKKSKSQNLSIYLQSSQSEKLADWKNSLQNLVQQKNPSNEVAWTDNEKWWSSFWDKSYIILNPENADKKDSVWMIGQRYQLFRYMLGCNAKGKYPTKFNGSFFTVDPYYYETPQPTPDSRVWGSGSFTSQNQRLVYWPMLKSGDFDMMNPQFDFFQNSIVAAQTWARHYWSHEGAYYCEQLNNFGIPVGTAYNWNRATYTQAEVYKKLQEPGLIDNRFIAFHYTGQVEFAFMILEYNRFTGNDISKWMPFVKESLKFIYEHYKYLSQKNGREMYDYQGKLNFYPSQAIETFLLAENPTDLIAGLKATLPLLIKLPAPYLNSGERKYFSTFLSEVPEISIENTRKNKEGNPVETISPAKSWKSISNMEAPQLYPLFPYGIYGIGKPGLEIARNTWRFSDYVPNRYETICWFQYGIFAARLGMIPEAEHFLKAKFFQKNMRFPAFWYMDNAFDQDPDIDHGGSAMIQLQEMLLQTLGNEIRPFPAWPKKWHVEFKLHSPGNTIVRGKWENGKMTSIDVLPVERQNSIVK